MGIFLLIFLGALQGLCEFLPISSSGHIVLFSKIFGIEETLFVSIVLHMATLLSIVIVFWHDVKYLICHPFSEQAMKIYVATLPTCLIVLVLMPVVNSSFSGNGLFVCFLLSALLLMLADHFVKKKKEENFSFKHAFIMGVAQGFAVFPGLSRSGTTIAIGLINNAKRQDCAKFSFLMSLPVILLSMVLEIFKICFYGEKIDVNWVGLGLSFIFAFIIGILSIKAMISLTQKVNFKWFALYLILVSIICIIIL